MLELLFLLLPVAAGYGWIMGRNSTKQRAVKSKASLSKQYSDGLNFLLSDQEEKAVEHLIEFLEVNADTLETHLTLANLFRKRGEIDKAIEIHEHLDKLQLDTPQAQKVTIELAKDYISAGMLDRAEKVLLNISIGKENQDEVLQMLVSIYQTMKDWNKSDQLVENHKNLGKRLTCTLSHHCCELADETKDNDSVVKWYQKALRYDGNCVRALLALAQMAEDSEKYQQAIEQYHHIIDLDKSYTPLVLDKIEQCFVNLGDRQQYYDYLQQAFNACQSNSGKPCISLLIKYSAYMTEFDSAQVALDFVMQALEKEPNVRAFAQVLALESKVTSSKEAAEQFARITALVNQYLAKKPAFECHQCGFATRQHYWLCPSCQTWGSSKPTPQQVSWS